MRGEGGGVSAGVSGEGEEGVGAVGGPLLTCRNVLAFSFEC